MRRLIDGAEVVVTQEGETEAAGSAPEARIEEVLEILRVSRLMPGRNGPCMEAARASRTA